MDNKKRKDPSPSHMPKNSLLFERVIPALLIFFAVVTVGLIVFAVGILLGWIAF